MKKIQDLDNIEEVSKSYNERGKRGASARWAKWREENNISEVVDDACNHVKETNLSNMLSNMYRMEWSDNELKDVWNIVTTLKRLGASI